MTREELAARIFSMYAHFDPQNCFKKADEFLAYAAKQRKPKACEHWGSSATEPCDYCKSCGAPKVKPETQKPEPNCEHKWVSDGGECYYCQKCNEPKAKKPEPPKPERGAREFNLYKFADGELRAFPSDQATAVYAGFTAPIFICATREILPGDEHDKR